MCTLYKAQRQMGHSSFVFSVWVLFASALFPIEMVAGVQQNLTYSAVPSLSNYQLGSILPISGLDVSSLAVGGSAECQSPYTVTNNSPGEGRIILIKVQTPLPEGCSIEVQMDSSPGMVCSGSVSADQTDRGLVDSMQKGSYQGKMHFKIRGNLGKVKGGNVEILYTLKSN